MYVYFGGRLSNANIFFFFFFFLFIIKHLAKSIFASDVQKDSKLS